MSKLGDISKILSVNIQALLTGKFSMSMIIETQIGVKPVNQLVKSRYFNDVIIKRVKIDPEALTYPPDFLRDPYTLLGKPIMEWPHYKLIDAIDKKKPLQSHEYFTRMKKGILDLRQKMSLPESYIFEEYRKKLKMIETGQPFEIKVYEISKGKYTVADGKHSIAMACYFNYDNINFSLIPSLIHDSYYRWIFNFIENNNNFLKHHKFLNESYEYIKTRKN
jgi:hypothetical protein